MPGSLVEYPFGQGLDQGTDPRRTPKFLAVQNYGWSKRGRLEKRYGYTTLPTIVAPTTGTASVASVTITNGGSGYSGAAAIYAVAGSGGGTGFVALGVEAGGVITAAVMSPTGVGYGFTSTPTLVVVGGGGTGATATATLGPNTPLGGSLTGTYTYRPTALGDVQVTDGQSVLTETPDGWRALGPLRNVSVKLAPTPITVQPPTSVVSANPVDAYVVSCAGRFVWWTSAGPAVQDITSGAFMPTNRGIHVLGGGVLSTGNVATDGSRWVWSFSGPSIVSAGVLFYPLDMSLPVPEEASVQSLGSGVGAAFPKQGSPISIDAFFDAVWNPVTHRLVAAYVLHGSTQITVTDWTWNVQTLQWDAGPLFETHTVSGTAYRLGCMAVNVCDDGNYILGWGYSDLSGTGNTVVRAVAQGNSAFTVYSASTPNECFDVLNIAIAQVSGENLSVVFTSGDQVPGDGPGGDFSPAGVFTACVHSFDITRLGSVTRTTVTNNTTLASRIFIQGGVPHVMLISGPGRSTVLASVAGVDTDLAPQHPATPGTVYAYFNGGVTFSGDGTADDLDSFVRSTATLPTPVSVAANVWLLPTTQADEPGTSKIMQLQQCTVTYGVGPTAPVTVQGALVYPTSVPSIAQITSREVQFMAPPIIVTHKFTAGGTMEPGNYTFVATFARVADDGSVTESQPSAPITLTVAAGQAVRIYVTDYALSGFASFAVGTTAVEATPAEYIVLYRTLVNQGSVLYRVDADPFTTGVANFTRFNAIPHDGGGDSASIQAHPQLYTGGGVFDNICPPACTLAARVRDRVYLAGTPDGFTVYYSDAVTSLGHTNFHDEQQIVVDDDGPVTGIAEMDANVFIFKENASYIVYGTEGSNTGQGSTLSTPVSLPSEGVGCISANSILSTTEGLLFQSHRGIELLNRKLIVSFIGETVKDETAGKTVLAAVLVPEQYQARFYMSDWSAVVMSTLNGEWTTFDFASKPTPTISDVSVVDGVVSWCGNGHIMQETVGAYSDNGSNIGAFWRSGWIQLGQLESYKRYASLQLLGQWFAETSIVTFILTDYRNDHIQTTAWTSDEIAALPEFDSNRIQLEIRPVLQKAEAVSIAALDAGPSDGTHTKGIGWEAVSFEIAQKAGPYRKLSTEASK